MGRYEVYWIDPGTTTGDTAGVFEDLGEAHTHYLDMLDDAPHLIWVLSINGAELTRYDPE